MLPLQVIRVEQLLLPRVGSRLQLLPGLVDLSLLAVSSISRVPVGGHQTVGCVVQLADLITQGGKVAFESLVFAYGMK